MMSRELNRADAARHIDPAFASGRIDTRSDRCFTKPRVPPDDGKTRMTNFE
jgi:hypothetical protein